MDTILKNLQQGSGSLYNLIGTNAAVEKAMFWLCNAIYSLICKVSLLCCQSPSFWCHVKQLTSSKHEAQEDLQTTCSELLFHWEDYFSVKAFIIFHESRLFVNFPIINRYYRRIVRWLRLRGVGRLYPLSVHTWLNLYDISRRNLQYTCYWSMHQVCTCYTCIRVFVFIGLLQT